MSPLLRHVHATRRALARAEFWSRFAPWAAWGMLGAGVVVLAGRVTVPALATAGAALALALPLAGALAALLGRRRPSLVEAAIVLDRRGALGGFPLLHLAHPGSPWTSDGAELAARASAAVPRLAPGFYARRLAPGLLFLAAALLVPQQANPFADLAPRRDSAAKREVQKLAEEVKKLEERKILPEQEIERLRQELKSLEAAAEKKALTQEAWEGLDHLSEQMRRAGQERSAQMGQAAAAAERLSETLSASKVDEAAKMEQLDALKRAMSGLPGVPMPEALRQALENLEKQGGLEGVDPSALKDAMSDLKEFLDENLKELAEGG
jgi:hypothetical protein